MNRISWLINRLRVMSPFEILFRVRRSIALKWEQTRIASGWKPMPSGEVVKTNCALFGNDANLLSKWIDNYQLDMFNLEAYMGGRINFFGHAPLDVGTPVAWHREPVTGTSIPSVFGKYLDYRDDRVVGNVKFIWELGRHQHLVPLAVAYVVSGDIRYRQAVVEQIDSWIEKNPFGMGIHWCSSLEVALRLISWSVVHSLFVLKDGESGLFDSVKDSARLGESIYQQAYFVRYFLSRYTSANNHLIGELTGLWVACQVFELGEDGRAWADFSKRELEIEAGKQIHADGVDKEQAFYYHLWVLDYLLFAWLIGFRCGNRFSDGFTNRILAMTRFLKDVCVDGGEPPQVGDADDGSVVRFDPTWPEGQFRELLQAIDVLFSGSDISGSQKTFWMYAMLPSDNESRPELDWHRSYPIFYEKGGYSILGDETVHLVFDAGPLGYLGIAAHGHADALSFCLAIENEWWIVDPGTYAYHSDQEWRSYFRGTAAHNTIRINYQNQSQMTGPFMWSRKANSRIDSYSNDKTIQVVNAHHDGYSNLGINHRRTLRYSSPDLQLEIIDTLESRRTRETSAEIFYHFSPDVDVEWSTRKRCWIATRVGRIKRLCLYMDESWDCTLLQGSRDPILGWYSPALEEKVPTNTLCGKMFFRGVQKSVTRIVIE